MSTQQFRLSVGSSKSIGPFDNYPPKQKPSWLCYLCGGNPIVDDDASNIQRKQKITLSRTTKTVKLTNLKTINAQLFLKDQKNNDGKNSYRLSFKNPQQVKFPKPKYQQKRQKQARAGKKSKTAKQNLKMVNSAVESFKNQYSLCNVSQANKFFNNMEYQSGHIGQPFSETFIQPITSMQNSSFYQTRSSHNMKTADSSSIQRSFTSVFIKSIPQVNSQQQLINPLAQVENQNFQYVPQNQILYRKPSLKDGKKFDQNFQNINQFPQELPNPPIVNHFPDIKLVDSVEKPKLQKLKSRKSISPIKRGSKLLTTLKKVSSRSQAPENGRQNESFFNTLGSKIKIGIRRVESFNSSDEDEDQYSQVLSHGQKSFLMTEINEVTEKSRVSEGSRFKFWQEQQKNPEN